jgi:hypothetical protein
MNEAFKYGFLNSIMGLVVGLHVWRTAGGDGYEVFALSAPIAVFIVGYLCWKIIVKELDFISIVIAGSITGTVSHYLIFLFISIGMNVCYWTTGGCTGSLGDAPAGIIEMISGSAAFSFFSLLFYGWITAPGAIILGLILKFTSKKKVAQQG